MTKTTKDRSIDSRSGGADGTASASADSADDSPSSIVAAGESSAGMISYDDLGQPRWTWVTEIAEGSDRIIKEDTFDYLKALATDALELADEPGAGPGDPVGGYDPYDTARIKMKGKFPRR